MIRLFLKLAAVHFLLDFPLQGDFLARGKNHRERVADVPWWLCLGVHSFLQAAGVYCLTGSLGLAGAELLAHALTDYMKNAGRLGDGERAFALDQTLHLAHKVVWVMLLGIAAA